MRFKASLQLALVALTLPTIIQGHTWVESIRSMASNGTFVGAEGFPRGFQSRSDPNFSDLYQTYQIENGHGSDPTLCNPHAQSSDSQGQFPRLQSTAGAAISLLYQENGHVTLPDTNLGKPANRGTVYIYATQQPQVGEKYYDVYQQWNVDGTGGDKRGILLSTQNFDDGQCFQVNNGQISKQRQAEFTFTPSNPMGTNLWCQNNIVIPANVDTSKLLTLYWVWKWDTAAGVDPNDMGGKNQTYTSCMDIDLLPSSTSKSASLFSYSKGQDVQRGGLSSIFNSLKNGNVFAVDPNSSGGIPSASSSVASSSSASTAASASSSVSTATSAATSGSTSCSSSSTSAAPPPPPNSSSSSLSQPNNCPAALPQSTETIFVFGTSVGTALPTGAGVTLSTASSSAGNTITVTEITTATHTAFVTVSGSQKKDSTLITFTTSEGSTSSPPNSAPVVSQISDGQPQAQDPTSTSTKSSPPQTTVQASVTTARTITISDNPPVQTSSSDSSVSFTFQPSSTGTVTFDSSAAATSTTQVPGSQTSSSAAATATTSTSNQAPPPAATSNAGSSSLTTATTATATATATGSSSAAPTFGTSLPSGIGKRCAPDTTAGTKVKRESRIFTNSNQDSQYHAEPRNHAREWRV